MPLHDSILLVDQHSFRVQFDSTIVLARLGRNPRFAQSVCDSQMGFICACEQDRRNHVHERGCQGNAEDDREEDGRDEKRNDGVHSTHNSAYSDCAHQTFI